MFARYAIITALAVGTIAMAAPAADAQRRPMRAMQTASQADSLPHSLIRCRVRHATMTSSGMSIQCGHIDINTQGEYTYRVAFNGGTRPGGISAAMSLYASHMDRRDNDDVLMIHIEPADATATQICEEASWGMITDYTCVKAISITG